MSLFKELKRRNVFRVAIAYLAGAWLLTEVSGTLFPAFGVPDWGVRFVVIVCALGFVPALIISWAYELTPEGLKREKDVVREVSITHFTAKRLDGITIGLIVVALAFILADRFWLSPRLAQQLHAPETVATDNVQISEPETTAPQYSPNSIAVLPFVNMSDDASNEYFSDGISEELLNLLSKVPGLRVISRSSAFSFKGKDTDIPTIAAQLNVAYVLEGSVRKAGNQVRITAQLIEVRSDSHLWSETYDRELENIFVVQDEISAAIVGAMKKRLGLQIETVPQMKTAASINAHDAYLRGRHLVAQRTKAKIEGAIREFEKAIALDPDFALAHAELAIANAHLMNWVYGVLTHTEGIARAVPHAERALALNPALAEAHAATGLVLLIQEKPEEALTHLRQAIQINPNYSDAYNWMRNVFLSLGDYAESFELLETALRLNPLSIPANTSYILGLYRRNRLEEVDQELEKLASIHPVVYERIRGYYMPPGGNGANTPLGTLTFWMNNPTAYIGGGHFLKRSFALLGLEKEVLANPEDRSAFVLRILGKPRDAVTNSEAHLAKDPSSLRARRILGLALASAGEYVRAEPILEDLWQQNGRRISFISLFKTAHAAALIAIRRDADADADVSELIAAIKDNVRHYREAGMTGADEWLSADYEAGIAAYLDGEHEKGLVLIAKGVEDGYFIPPKEAYLQVLYDDPDFAPIREMQEAWQNRERNKFLAIVCTDNPYAAVWQPEEDTCERFAADSGN